MIHIKDKDTTATLHLANAGNHMTKVSLKRFEIILSKIRNEIEKKIKR